MKGTEAAKIKHGKHTYNFSKVYREGGGCFYMAKRSDSKKPLGNIFQTKQDMMNHYPSIAGEIRAMKFKVRR